MCEFRQNKLITSPFLVTNLVSHQEVQLKFTAPMKPGNYTYHVGGHVENRSLDDFMRTLEVKLSSI